MVDRATVWLAIDSVELTAAEISKALGIFPDKEWNTGDAIGRTGRVRDENTWYIEETLTSDQCEESANANLIPRVTEMFSNRVRPFLDRIATLGSSVECYTVLSFLAHEAPGIELSHSFLEVLAGIGGTFQIDPTIYGPEDEMEGWSTLDGFEVS